MSLIEMPYEPLQKRCGRLLADDIDPPESEEEDKRVTFADLKIRTKDKRLVPFTPNEVQEQYLDILTAEYGPTCGFDWRNGVYTLRGIREDVLKARQQGMSTLWLALYFLDTINNPLTESHVYAHDGETTEKLFRVVHRFYENLPPHKKRPKRFSNRREIVFADTESGIFVGMVGGSALGRGGTVNNAHLSERAWNDNYAELEVGLLQAVPEGGNVTRETTANGFNEYYEERTRAARGESRFKPRFFGWHLHSEYRMRPRSEDNAGIDRYDSLSGITDEEHRLIEDYSLDAAQILWRREKMKDLKDKFPQEFPISEAEAFLASGSPVFDRASVMVINTEVQGAEHDPRTDIMIPRDTFPNLWQVYRDGKLKIWQPPRPGHLYVLPADTAEGLDPLKGDYDAAMVFDYDTWEQCAVLWGHWDTILYGRILAELGLFYNTALLAPELNNTGYGVINSIITEDYPNQRGNGCTGLYFHDPKAISEDSQSTQSTRKAGWPTNVKTKHFAAKVLNNAIIEENILWHDRETAKELLTYVNKGGGKMGGDGTALDDLVSAAMIGAALLHLRFENAKRKTAGDEWEQPQPTGSGVWKKRRG